jgi:RNA polymerase sigma-70 factor (ECF subfamily)
VAELYCRTGSLVLRRCRLLLGDPAEAEDAMQEVYLRLLRYGHSLRQDRVPLAWLYRTAERCCFDRRRKRAREPICERDTLVEALSVPAGDARYEAGRLVLRFFDGLTEKLQRVALMHYVDGLTQERIAVELGWSRRTVGKKIAKLRRRAERMARTRGESAP